MGRVDANLVARWSQLRYAHSTMPPTSTSLTPKKIFQATLGAPYVQWSTVFNGDGKRIQTVLRPNDGAVDLPKRNAVATEPKVRVTRGGNNPTRTYRYLLESPYDMKLLESLVTGQVALIDVNDGKITKIGFPNLIRSVSMGPNEENFRVTTMKKPFSYYVPLTRFGSQEGIWNLEGKSLYTLNDRNLQETEPQRAANPTVAAGGGQRVGRGGRGGRGPGQCGQGGQVAQGGQRQAPQPDPTVGPTQPPADPNADPTAPPAAPVDPNAKRDIGWRPDGVGMSFLQLEPAKPDSQAARKDRVMQWLPPFGKNDEKVVYETPNRITGLQYSDNCKMLFLTQTVDGSSKSAPSTWRTQDCVRDCEILDAAAIRRIDPLPPAMPGRRF